jgi:hypothetical protein
MENENAYPLLLVTIDLQELFESPSIATTIATITSSYANET